MVRLAWQVKEGISRHCMRGRYKVGRIIHLISVQEEVEIITSKKENQTSVKNDQIQIAVKYVLYYSEGYNLIEVASTLLSWLTLQPRRVLVGSHRAHAGDWPLISAWNSFSRLMYLNKSTSDGKSPIINHSRRRNWGL